MVKRKFGRYTVSVGKTSKTKRSDGLIETRTEIEGDVEIGIQIETMTWREDWLAQQVFGKNESDNYRLINVQNCWLNNTCEKNLVTAVWKKLNG